MFSKIVIDLGAKEYTMKEAKADILAQLRKDILPLQGYKPSLHNNHNVGLGFITNSFPNNKFPFGAIHEFLCAEKEEAAASYGFIAGVVSSIIKTNGIALWIGNGGIVFPPGLKAFGIAPDKIIFIDVKNEKKVLWTVEESLKCAGLSVVIAELEQFSFMASRRLQLAVEKNGVTGFMICKNVRSLHTTTSVARWQIRPLPSVPIDDLPGVSFPRWDVALLKVRNGKPGNWYIEWDGSRFLQLPKNNEAIKEVQMKTA